jgi:ubiquinone/menaquinone biosynthesis C-methylase UbiE
MFEEEATHREKTFHDKYFNKEIDRADQSKFYEPITRGIINNYCMDKFKEASLGMNHIPSVLYYGCGENVSYIKFFCNELKAKVTAIDISDNAINNLKKTLTANGYGNVETVVMDAQELDYPDNTFDIVFGRGIIHHLDIDKSMTEVYRVLKPNGFVIFIEPLCANPFISIYRRLTPSKRTIDEHPLSEIDLSNIKHYYSKANFQYFYLTTLPLLAIHNILPKSVYKILLQCSIFIDYLVLKIFPWARKYFWIVVMQLKK